MALRPTIYSTLSTGLTNKDSLGIPQSHFTCVVVPNPEVEQLPQTSSGGHHKAVNASPVESHPRHASDVTLPPVPRDDELHPGLAGGLGLGSSQH